MIVQTGPEIVAWTHARINYIRPDPNLAQGLGFIRDGFKAGAIYFDHNGVNCEIAIAVEMGFHWSRKALELLFSYPFYQLSLRRITARVSSDNFESRRFVERLGCTLEARMERASPTGDLLCYRMFREDCRFLVENRSVRTIQPPARTRHA